MNLSDIIPARWRYGIYSALVVSGVGLGSIQAWCTAAQVELPEWHGPALAVLGYLSAAIGLVAAANVNTPEGEPVPPPARRWDDEPGSDDLRGERD